jgi:hypothetical protein
VNAYATEGWGELFLAEAGVDRDCPLGTVLVRPMWHASGTAGEENMAQAWL